MPASRLPSLPDSLPARLHTLRVDDAAAWARYLSTRPVRSLTRIQATVLDSNARSIAVPERLGMQRAGLLCAYRKVRGHPRNFWMYAHLEGTVASPL